MQSYRVSSIIPGRSSPVYYIVFVCVVILFILNVRFVDVQEWVTQEEGHGGFLHLPSAVRA